MANNFKISMYRTSYNLSIQLKGDFDGSSAAELLNTLQTHLNETDCISIDTRNLRNIHPFGGEVFRQNLFKLKRHLSQIKFLGKNAEKFLPAEMEYLYPDKHHHEPQNQNNSWVTIEAEHGKNIN